jgi:hypothetical protein
MLSYLFHSSVWWGFQTALRICIFVAPTSMVQQQLVANFEEWGIRVVVDGESAADDKPNDSQCTLTVHNRRFFKKVALNSTLGLGEAYMDGWFTCSDLPKMYVILGGKKSKDSFIFRCLIHLRNNMVTSQNLQTRGSKSMEVADTHYNLGNDLYTFMLGERCVENQMIDDWPCTH